MQALFLHRACTMHVWYWYGTSLFLALRVLVLSEFWDGDVVGTGHLIATNEATISKLHKESLNVAVVIRQALGLDALRAVLKPAIPVSLTPLADKQDARERIA